jgi:hypothetical protein
MRLDKMESVEEAPIGALPILATNSAVLAHLNMLQSIISRLAGNSAQCKTWCLAIVSALFGFASATKSGHVLDASIVPILILGATDGFYLSRERAFRKLYVVMVDKIRSGTYATLDVFDLGALTKITDVGSALRSWSVWPIYVGLLIAYALARMFGLPG